MQKKQIIYIIVISILLLVFAGPNLLIKWASTNKTYEAIIDIPKNRVGLLLGTSKYVSKGQINLYYKYRIDAAVELYNAGKIEFILISGDNGQIEYNEPKTIRDDLIKYGIPNSKIYLDYAGFRTWDSIIRAKKVFGESEFTVISQKFHNQRAIFIGMRSKMKLVGFNAKDVPKNYGSKTRLREIFARIKLILDILINKQPKYLGSTIEIK